MVNVNDDLLAILACPKCKGTVRLLEQEEVRGIACDSCCLLYPVRDDIPVMLIEEALPLGGSKEA